MFYEISTIFNPTLLKIDFIDATPGEEKERYRS